MLDSPPGRSVHPHSPPGHRSVHPHVLDSPQMASPIPSSVDSGYHDMGKYKYIFKIAILKFFALFY